MIFNLKLNNSLLTDGHIVRSSLNKFHEDLTSDEYSLKIPLSGSENYKIESRCFDVKDNQFLITNPHQEVIAEVDSKEKVNGLCIYINADVMEDVFFSSDNLFTDEDKNMSCSPLILEHTYAANFDELGFFVNSIKQILFTADELDSDEFFYNLSELILKKRRKVHFQYFKIDALKLSTKKELYRRLDVMHQRIQENYKDAISINDLSKSIGISKFHSIRLYKKVYGTSPYRHIQEMRLDKSLELLKFNTIKDVSYLLNYSDRRAFSKSFKKRYGLTPSDYVRFNA